MIWFVALAVLLALPGAVSTVHMLTMTAGALLWRPLRGPLEVERVRFLVLVPARDEQSCIRATLGSIQQALRPGDQLLVVADHCTDDTAALARAAGALVLERDRGSPGRAAARQDGIDQAAALDWDAVAFVDADTLVSPGYLDDCERMLGAADVVQTRAEALPARGVLGHAATAAAALQGVVLPRGRDRLGLMVGLRGSGLVLRRSITERFSFHAPISEDGVLAAELCLAGIRSRHADGACLRPQSTTSLTAAGGQRVRWEAGRVSNALAFAGPLMRAGHAPAVEMAVYLISPPFSLAVASLVAGATTALVVGATALAVTILGLLAGLALVLAVALATVHARPATWLSLLAAPWYVLWKLVIQIRALAHLRRGRTGFGATPR